MANCNISRKKRLEKCSGNKNDLTYKSMAIVKCSKCGKDYNSVLPVCPSCGLDVSTSEVIDENGSLLDGTGGKDFKIIHRLNATFGNDVTIFKKDSRTYGVAQSIHDIVLPRMNYVYYSFIDETVTKGFLRVNIETNGTKRWGIIDVNGRLILPVVYDNIWRLRPQFIDNIRIEKDGRYYFINLEETADTGILKILHSGIIESTSGKMSALFYAGQLSYDDGPVDSNFVDEVCSVFNSGLYNDALDIDQQSPEFWNSL